MYTYIDLPTLHSEYVELSRSVRALLPINFCIKELIVNLGIDSDKLKVFQAPLYMRKITEP